MHCCVHTKRNANANAMRMFSRQRWTYKVSTQTRSNWSITNLAAIAFLASTSHHNRRNFSRSCVKHPFAATAKVEIFQLCRQNCVALQRDSPSALTWSPSSRGAARAALLNWTDGWHQVPLKAPGSSRPSSCRSLRLMLFYVILYKNAALFGGPAWVGLQVKSCYIFHRWCVRENDGRKLNYFQREWRDSCELTRYDPSVRAVFRAFEGVFGVNTTLGYYEK